MNDWSVSFFYDAVYRTATAIPGPLNIDILLHTKCIGRLIWLRDGKIQLTLFCSLKLLKSVTCSNIAGMSHSQMLGMGGIFGIVRNSAPQEFPNGRKTHSSCGWFRSLATVCLPFCQTNMAFFGIESSCLILVVIMKTCTFWERKSIPLKFSFLISYLC